MAGLTKVKNVIDKIFEIISTIILGVMTILVVYQVVTRYVFNAPQRIFRNHLTVSFRLDDNVWQRLCLWQP